MDVGLSTERVTIYGVDVSAADIAKVPVGNVRVPRAEFVALWQTAERLHLSPSPVTRRISVAYDELIEAECLAAEKLAARRPVPAWLNHRPRWIEAVVATLNWAWRRYGSPPLEYLQPNATGSAFHPEGCREASAGVIG